MNTLHPQVDKYMADGCMRCKLGGTPACKVNDWREVLETLRNIVLECGLTEELKWGVPCYTYQGKNVAIISAFKEYGCLSFFKGALLDDSQHLLVKPGESSQAARYVKFTSPREVAELADVLKAYILNAVELEKSGQKVAFAKNPEPLPEELLLQFEASPELKRAFYALTPGRQRGYVIYFSQPRQSQSRMKRIEKCTPRILNGEGLNDR
ncbi:MAG: hypothetical protein RI973_1921 [Bacteroidota bacterium]|jgi:uncharacterized protein YdeI (YjbR/CyaY-like superfamily)